MSERDIYAGTTRRADTYDGITDGDGLYWISCSPALLEAMKSMELDGYRTCAEAPRRPGGATSHTTAISHFHAVPMAIASTWDQYAQERLESAARRRTAAVIVRPLMEATDEQLREALIWIGPEMQRRLRVALFGEQRTGGAA